MYQGNAFIDSKATVQVFVCNNVYDASPAWEDCTAEYLAGKSHTFTNTDKTNANWGLAMRVVIMANDATGVIEISSIGMGVS